MRRRSTVAVQLAVDASRRIVPETSGAVQRSNGSDGRDGIRKTGQVKLLPAFVVDRLPDDCWRPGNLRRVLGVGVHFGDDDHVKSIEVDGRLIAQGRKLFPYGRWG